MSRPCALQAACLGGSLSPAPPRQARPWRPRPSGVADGARPPWARAASPEDLSEPLVLWTGEATWPQAICRPGAVADFPFASRTIMSAVASEPMVAAAWPGCVSSGEAPGIRLGRGPGWPASQPRAATVIGLDERRLSHCPGRTWLPTPAGPGPCRCSQGPARGERHHGKHPGDGHPLLPAAGRFGGRRSPGRPCRAATLPQSSRPLTSSPAAASSPG